MNDVEKTRSWITGRNFAMLVAGIALMGLALESCGKEETEVDGELVDTSTVETIAPAAIDTTTGASAADTAAPVVPPSREAILAEMKEKFELMGGMENVTIEPDDAGHVVLTGTVPTPDRKQTAEDAALLVPGVVSVDNRIVVAQ